MTDARSPRCGARIRRRQPQRVGHLSRQSGVHMREVVDRALADGRTKYEGRSMPTRSVHADGRTIYVELSFGMVHEDAQHFVQMTTSLGGRRIVDWLSGEQLPRIC